MIKILYKLESGHADIVIRGHANSAQYGQDIICAGVSAIIQAAILGLESIAESYPQYVEIKEIKDKEDIE